MRPTRSNIVVATSKPCRWGRIAIVCLYAALGCARVAPSGSGEPSDSRGSDIPDAPLDNGVDSLETILESDATDDVPPDTDDAVALDSTPDDSTADAGPSDSLADTTLDSGDGDAAPPPLFASDRPNLRALSIIGEYVYWGCHPSTGFQGSILRRRRDGTGKTEVIYERDAMGPRRILGLVDGLAVLDELGSVFTIKSGSVRVVAESLISPMWLAEARGTLYWTHSSGVGPQRSLMAASVGTGEAPRPILTLIDFAAWPVVTDDKDLWLTSGIGLLHVDLTSTPYSAVTVSPKSTLPWLRAYGGYVYWAASGGIQRASTSTSAVETVHSLPMVGFGGIAVDADGVFFIQYKDYSESFVMRLTTAGAVRIGTVEPNVSDIVTDSTFVYVGGGSGKIYRIPK